MTRGIFILEYKWRISKFKYTSQSSHFQILVLMSPHLSISHISKTWHLPSRCGHIDQYTLVAMLNSDFRIHKIGFLWYNYIRFVRKKYIYPIPVSCMIVHIVTPLNTAFSIDFWHNEGHPYFISVDSKNGVSLKMFWYIISLVGVLI